MTAERVITPRHRVQGRTDGADYLQCGSDSLNQYIAIIVGLALKFPHSHTSCGVSALHSRHVACPYQHISKGMSSLGRQSLHVHSG